MKEVLLYSGGMDSLIAWEYLKRPETLYINLKHKYYKEELSSVLLTVPDTKILDSALSLGAFETAGAEIPMRNMYMAMAAASLGYEKIWLVVQKDEMSIPDRTEKFFLKASEMISFLMGKTVVVNSPFKHMDKIGRAHVCTPVTV